MIDQENVQDNLHALFMLLTYPVYGCFKWARHLKKEKIEGRKFFGYIALCGLVSWCLAVASFWIPMPWQIVTLIIAVLLYIYGGVCFCLLTIQKKQEVEQNRPEWLRSKCT